jgi:aspartate/methionine/tyrosine aminotransferase
MAALLAVVDPGDEVIVFEPFYENYGPDTVLSGAIPRYVTLHEPDWSIDQDELEQAFNNRTRAIIINTPNNPTGKVFSRQELETIAQLCLKWNVTAITDEIYEHMAFDLPHIRMADIDGMGDQTITISGLSKTFSATGWRIGWLIAPSKATDSIRKVHDFLTVGAAAPLQQGAAYALQFPDSYFTDLNTFYRGKRDFFIKALNNTGFIARAPQGAYYVMASIEELGWSDDVAFAKRLINNIGVAVVPGSSFYSDSNLGRGKVRFCFCKRPETLELAANLLSGVRDMKP